MSVWVSFFTPLTARPSLSTSSSRFRCVDFTDSTRNWGPDKPEDVRQLSRPNSTRGISTGTSGGVETEELGDVPPEGYLEGPSPLYVDTPVDCPTGPFGRSFWLCDGSSRLEGRTLGVFTQVVYDRRHPWVVKNTGRVDEENPSIEEGGKYPKVRSTERSFRLVVHCILRGPYADSVQSRQGGQCRVGTSSREAERTVKPHFTLLVTRTGTPKTQPFHFDLDDHRGTVPQFKLTCVVFRGLFSPNLSIST